MDAREPAGLEERLSRAIRFHARADALEPVEQLAPHGPHAVGIGRHEAQAGAARERLAEPHAGLHAERLGGRRHLPYHLRPSSLGSQSNRLRQERAPVA